MNADALETIREAIRKRRQLTFTVNGHYRIACPHLLGRKHGEWHVFTWQINDESENGFKPGAQRWRCFDLDDMSGVAIQDGDWHRGWTTGKRKQSCIDVIDTQVDPAYAAQTRNTSPAHTL